LQFFNVFGYNEGMFEENTNQESSFSGMNSDNAAKVDDKVWRAGKLVTIGKRLQNIFGRTKEGRRLGLKTHGKSKHISYLSDMMRRFQSFTSHSFNNSADGYVFLPTQQGDLKSVLISDAVDVFGVDENTLYKRLSRKDSNYDFHSFYEGCSRMVASIASAAGVPVASDRLSSKNAYSAATMNPPAETPHDSTHRLFGYTLAGQPITTSPSDTIDRLFGYMLEHDGGDSLQARRTLEQA